jgi:hypothetical protein
MYTERVGVKEELNIANLESMPTSLDLIVSGGNVYGLKSKYS